MIRGCGPLRSLLLRAMQADDTSLIRSFREGDEEAFQALFEPHVGVLQARIQPRMAQALRRKVSVADVLQETRIVAFELREGFDGGTASDFRNWLLAIADRKIRQAVALHVRSPKRALNREVSRAQRMETACAPGREPSPSQQAIASELESIAREALRKLSREQQEVLHLFREEGLSVDEVAQRIGRSYEGTKKLRQRALFEYTEAFRRMQGRDHE